MSKSDEALPGARSGLDPLIELGRITRPHGVRGALILRVDPSLADAITPGTILEIAARDREVRKAVPVKGGLRLVLDGIDDRDQAEALAGALVRIRRDLLPPLAPTEYYDVDVLGIAAATADGQALGPVTEVVRTGANDVFVIDGTAGEIMVPVIDGVVLELDVEARRLVVDPVGLVYPTPEKAPRTAPAKTPK